ncbi:GntR family transcriptional regulator [Phaeobacter gallaeciensis]|uniref:GntR family transcriptional regulator n=1 Tax=Phaeobacter gallaeciensis TaxID=60890 RepID=UPI00237F95C4|nr:GntR family transcriptional regulator [Phaeobacter gallaeciensis]MDE4306174.1 GntR family transcriptional regulator [Phaeobacter gallaeciensis]MDE4310640.1 GntR family transcriptional regulator [Phaeobacter gallaeciensis]MDE4314630.1 GntR family transcriptional regulator [Phaeobacter gallaeciensis]MDE4319568.1 GntR family transcriptional regulator [Phaeobacter gallaeciensis]MDE4323996.1 GntR family transcriptional regulator [Phaeobacter gallaeciensis]
MAEFNRPKSLTELVTENLRDRILTGEFDLGEQLSEARIAKSLSVSRTPVREAINRLEMEGLLVVEPQRGSFVFNLEPEELAKLCDARMCLETAAVTYAIEARPADLHRALEACVTRMTEARDAGNDAEYLAQDTVFHQCFFDFADNRFLNDAYQTIALKMTALRNRLGGHPEHMAKSYREHQDLVKAVKNLDIPAALAILREHIDRKEGSYWSAVTEPEKV